MEIHLYKMLVNLLCDNIKPRRSGLSPSVRSGQLRLKKQEKLQMSEVRCRTTDSSAETADGVSIDVMKSCFKRLDGGERRERRMVDINVSTLPDQ